MIILEENESQPSVIGSARAPYLNSLAADCGTAANYHNATHPSLPNYINLMAGSVQGLAAAKDCSFSGCPQSQNSLFAELDASSLSWKSYAESATSICQTRDTTLYAQRHVPAVYFSNIHATSCRRNVVAMTAASTGGPTVTDGNLSADLSAGTLPAFSFVSPNLCDDGHSVLATVSYCSSNRVANLDHWLAVWVPAILNGPNYSTGDTEVFIVFDEGAGRDKMLGETCWDQQHENTTAYPSCWTSAVFVGPNTPAITSKLSFNHFNTLNALTSILGVPDLPQSTETGGVATPNDLRDTFHL